MLSFLLYWYLPAFVIAVISFILVDKKFTVGDLRFTIVMSLLGWISIFCMIYVVMRDYEDKVIYSKSK